MPDPDLSFIARQNERILAELRDIQLKLAVLPGIRADLARLEDTISDLAFIDQQLANVLAEQRGIREELSLLRADVQALRTDVALLREEVRLARAATTRLEDTIRMNVLPRLQALEANRES